MEIPFFYIGTFDPSEKEIVLDEETSKHVVQVLRMKSGEKINLTDGKGSLLLVEIIGDNRKHCNVRVIDSRFPIHDSRLITIAISLLKNASRFEWFLEKATEIGVNEIIPLICERTEKQKFRQNRAHNIMVSAMLQSKQSWLPQLHEPMTLKSILQEAKHQQKFIAHCIPKQKRKLVDLVNDSLDSQIILIGPEGDFSSEEVDLALQNHFAAVSLGDTRLRSETAAMVAASVLKLG